MSDLRGRWKNEQGAELTVFEPAGMYYNTLSDDIWMAKSPASLGGLVPRREYLVTEESLAAAGYKREEARDD